MYMIQVINKEYLHGQIVFCFDKNHHRQVGVSMCYNTIVLPMLCTVITDLCMQPFKWVWGMKKREKTMITKMKKPQRQRNQDVKNGYEENVPNLKEKMNKNDI